MRNASPSDTAGARYVPINLTEMRDLLAGEMGFSPLPTAPGQELVFARQIGKRPVELRVYTSVTPDNGVSRDVGEDAIRVTLHSLTTQRPVGVKFSRVYRTKNALSTLKERAREAWGYAKEHCCQKCCGVLVERTNRKTQEKFWSCASYPECK